MLNQLWANILTVGAPMEPKIRLRGQSRRDEWGVLVTHLSGRKKKIMEYVENMLECQMVQ